VLSLRSFAKLDESEWKQADLHEGLNNTLILLSYRLQANSHRKAITISKDYGEFPLIYCNLAQLNQVFMNVLVHAIEAIDAKYRNETEHPKEHLEAPKISLHPEINTSNKESLICVKIKDNGVGISPQIKSRIFERFFTTKSTGKETGLGLAIARQIVTEQQGGTITCSSELGQGTELRISLPLHNIKSDSREIS